MSITGAVGIADAGPTETDIAEYGRKYLDLPRKNLRAAEIRHLDKMT